MYITACFVLWGAIKYKPASKRLYLVSILCALLFAGVYFGIALTGVTPSLSTWVRLVQLISTPIVWIGTPYGVILLGRRRVKALKDAQELVHNPLDKVE